MVTHRNILNEHVGVVVGVVVDVGGLEMVGGILIGKKVEEVLKKEEEEYEVEVEYEEEEDED